MSSADIQARIGPALVDYSGSGAFPDDELVAAAHIEDTILPDALNLLNNAKTELEVHFLALSTPPSSCILESRINISSAD